MTDGFSGEQFERLIGHLVEEYATLEKERRALEERKVQLTQSWRQTLCAQLEGQLDALKKA